MMDERPEYQIPMQPQPGMPNGTGYPPQAAYPGGQPNGTGYPPQAVYPGGQPNGTGYPPQAVYPGGQPEMRSASPEPAAPAPKKKSKKGLLIVILAAAAALLIGAAVFLLSYFSPDARFDRAMKEASYEEAEEIFRGETLKASKQNDSHYLTLANRHLERFQGGAEDRETAVAALRALEEADLDADTTRISIRACEKTVFKTYISQLGAAFREGRSDYITTLSALIALKAEELPDEDTRQEVEACEESVIRAQLDGIYDAYRSGQLDYFDAVAQLRAGNPYAEELAANLINEYLAKADEQREELYAEAVGMITDQEDDHTPEEILAALEPFSGYRSADALIGIFRELQAGNGVAAAQLLLESQEQLDAESSSSLAFETIQWRIRNLYLSADTAYNDYTRKLDLKIQSDYVDLLFGDDSGKIASLFGGETSKSIHLSKEFDMDWFASCEGGTGKILYLARYLNSSSGDSYDSYYYYRYENPEDIPLERMPSSLAEVEYLIVFEQGGTFYDTYHSSSGSSCAVYRRTIRVTVIQFPSGEVIYDSGVLTGPTPNSTITVFSGTKYAYGDPPDLSAVEAKVKALVGLE